MLRSVLPAAAGLLLTGCSVLGIRSTTETPPYTLVAVLDEGVEVRHYPPRLAAETTVAATDAEAGRSAAFRLLFAYISGANRPQAAIAMTTPVEVAATDAGGKIAMTAPVETLPAADGLTMRFLLPPAYTPATAPEPTDPAVRLVVLPEMRLAVLRFSGSTGAAAVAERQAQLAAVVGRSSWQPTDAPLAMFYDPPWTLPFLRRNEVAVAVTAASPISSRDR